MDDHNHPAAGTASTASYRLLTPELLFEQRYGTFGARERRQFHIDTDEVRDSGAGTGQFTIRGHAAVFDSWSLDLGGFREKVDRAAFDNALSRSPNVYALWDHDTRYVLASTRNKTLELRTDPRGLHYWARVAPTGYAADLRVLMERGDIAEASFAFTVARDEWRVIEEDGEERVERTILEVGDLFDVTVTAMGAYPATDSQVVRSKALDYARQHGRLPGQAGADNIAPDDPAGVDESHRTVGSDLKARLEQARRRARMQMGRTPNH